MSVTRNDPSSPVSWPARLAGSSLSGICELAVFHPVDTTIKRLMANKGVWKGQLNQVIFKEHANAGSFAKWKSLFPGLGFGGAYKILQRTYKYGGQPVVFEYLRKNHSDTLQSRTLQQAVSGSIMGIGEVVLLPLDVLKIRAQTNPDALKGKGVINIFATEGFALYRGIGWTVARNAPGSFALFGGNSLAKSQMGLDGTMTGQATTMQNFISSTAGAWASISVAQPLDVIKTRVQNQPFENPQSGMQVISNLLKTEGPGAFFKGFTPKLMVVGPKLVFSMTIAQSFMRFFADM